MSTHTLHKNFTFETRITIPIPSNKNHYLPAVLSHSTDTQKHQLIGVMSRRSIYTSCIPVRLVYKPRQADVKRCKNIHKKRTPPKRRPQHLFAHTYSLVLKDCIFNLKKCIFSTAMKYCIYFEKIYLFILKEYPYPYTITTSRTPRPQS